MSEPSSGLWEDVRELPESLAATLEARDGFDDTAALLGAADVRRIVATGNGAAYYVALALWLASLDRPSGPEVVAIPSGLVARGTFRWRRGDVLLAVSSSGEFRDLVEAVHAGAPAPYAAITADAASTLGAGAGARALVTVLHQRAVTHTQAFCGGVLAALALWAEITEDGDLLASIRRLPEALDGYLAGARAWSMDVASTVPSFGLVFGTGPGWAAALEAALLLREVAGVPAEGIETREAATTSMMALGHEHLVLSLSAGTDDASLLEAEAVCRQRGAHVLRAPAPLLVDRRLLAVTTFPAALAFSEQLGVARGIDVDRPSWVDAYYSVARRES
jgi:fructoselysine-6-P-deglycase FrlB-like protein